jgi:hypothetical protein
MSIPKKNTPPINKRVPSLAAVDYSDMKMPMIVVYNSPADFPGKVIARVWEGSINRPTNVYCEYKTIAKCREDAEAAGFTICIPRSPMDDKSIVGTYMK